VRAEPARPPAAPRPLAGYHAGRFFLRDATDNFRLYPVIAALIDSDVWIGSGVHDIAGLSPRMSVRAARVGASGQILEPLSFSIVLAADGQPLANAGGTNQRAAAPPGTTPDQDSARYADAQTADNRAFILDAWLGLAQSRALNLMVGQYRVPFSFDNATPLRALPLRERALAVRALGAPEVRDIGATAWGDLDFASASYAIGVFQGDGRNRPGVDAYWDVMGRITWRPLSKLSADLAGAQIGLSGRAGWRDGTRVSYDYSSFRSQQGFELWVPVYTDSLGRRVHVIPNDAQRAAGAEFFVPLQRFDFAGELVLVKNGTREAVDGFVATNTERTGALTGAGGYLLAGYWLWGKPRLLRRGLGVRPPDVDFDKADPASPPQAVELALRLELLEARYDSNERAGVADSSGLDGDIEVTSLGLAVNYWATEHARLSLTWSSYYLPAGSGNGNRARAPDPEARSFHELGARLGVMF
jgi:hypothetical protein